MGKYPGYYTSQDVSRCECKEASHILRKYGVPRKVRKHIISMIKEPWFQLSETFRFQSSFEKYLKEIWDIDLNDPNYIKGYFRWECMNAKGSFMKFIGKAFYGITDLYGLGIDFKKIAIRLLAVYCGFRDICPCIKQGHSFYP